MTECAELVKDVRRMAECVVRMQKTNEATVFWSASREFRIMLRNVPEVDPPGNVAFEVCVVEGPDNDEEENTGLPRVLELEYDGYFEEDGAFVFDLFVHTMEEIVQAPEVLEPARKRLNALHAFTICPCGAHFIKDGARMCLFCQLTADPPGEHTCAICLETCPTARHMVKQPCCGQMLHHKCMAKWAGPCPMCRASP